MRLPLEWTKHLGNDEEARESFENLLRNSGISLGRLKTILEEKRSALEMGGVSSQVYDKPNWEYRVADLNGCLRTLDQVIKLLAFLDEPNTKKEVNNARRK